MYSYLPYIISVMHYFIVQSVYLPDNKPIFHAIIRIGFGVIAKSKSSFGIIVKKKIPEIGLSIINYIRY